MANSKYKLIDSKKGAFKFKVDGSDKLWSLPLIDCLPVKSAMRLRDSGDGIEGAVALIDELCPGLTDVLTLDGMTQLFDAWNEASGISAGE